MIAFFAVVLSGPAGMEWIERRRTVRRAIEDRATARVLRLPSSTIRSSCPAHRGEYPCLELDRPASSSLPAPDGRAIHEAAE